MNNSDLRARKHRLLALPLITAVLAGGVWWWSSMVEPRRDAEVLAFVEQLVAEAAPPRPSMAPFGATEPFIVELVRSSLGRCASDGVLPTLQVRRGDVEGRDGRATHHVVVEDANEGGIVLRLVHSGDPSRIVVIGFDVSG